MEQPGEGSGAIDPKVLLERLGALHQQVEGLAGKVEGIEELKTGLATIAKAAETAAAAQKRPPAEPSAKDGPSREDIRVGLFEKPDEILGSLIEQKNKPVVGLVLETRRQMAKMEARTQHQDWERYAAEIDSVEQQVTPSALAMPGAYEALYRMVKGRHTDDLVKEAVANAAKDPANFKEGPGRGPAKTPQEKAAATELSADEDAARSLFGLSKEEWIKYQGFGMPEAKEAK
jgi:hypothetical protein